MVVRRFNFKGKPVYLDELFNISADKEQDKHLGVLQVKADGSEFYIAPKVRRTKEALKDDVERENFQEAKALFNTLVKAAMAKKSPAPAVRAPAPVAPVAAPVVVPRPVVMSERGGVTVKKQVGRLLTASQQEELEERREAAARLRYEKEEREAEQAYYMAEE